MQKSRGEGLYISTRTRETGFGSSACGRSDFDGSAYDGSAYDDSLVAISSFFNRDTVTKHWLLWCLN